MLGIFAGITGTIVAFLTFIRSLFVCQVRLSKQQSEYLLREVLHNGYSWELTQEITDDDKLPAIFRAYCYYKKRFFTFVIEERMLQAGFRGTDSVAQISISRWHYQWLENEVLVNCRKAQSNGVPVYILLPWDAEKVCTLDSEDVKMPLIDRSFYEIVDREVQEVVDGKRRKTGAILHGPPGNGKSFFIRHFALKYKLPIYIVSFIRDIDNHGLIRMFNYIKGPAVVLLEDFDNYFDKRRCTMGTAHFTFDTLLNVLDGSYTDPQQLCLFMTANDINKVDVALRCRPSRFRFVREIGNPKDNLRAQVFPSELFVKETEGMTTDSVLQTWDLIQGGCTIREAAVRAREIQAEVEEAELEAKKSKEEDNKEEAVKASKKNRKL